MPEAAYGKATRWLTVITLNAGQATSDTTSPSQEVFTVMKALETANIESRPIWKPMHLQPVFRSAKIFGGEVNRRLFNAGLCLPTGASLTQSDVERICGIVKRSL